MIYSVWNQGRREFDYYESPGGADRANADAPHHIRARPMGAVPAEVGWPLPAGARLVGRGASARGRIASTARARAGLGLDLDHNTVGIVGLGIAAVLLWRHLRR